MIRERLHDAPGWAKVLTGIAAAGLLVLVAYGVTSAVLMAQAYDSDLVASVDGTITRGETEVERVTGEAFGATPADVVRDDATAKDRRVAVVVVGRTGDSSEDEKIIEALDASGVEAAFALSAAEVREDPDYAKGLVDAGRDLVSNGVDGRGNLHSKDLHDLVGTMYRSREEISSSTGGEPTLFYASGTTMTADVLRAASASGYEAVIDADQAHCLDNASLATEADARSFVQGLEGDSIVVIDLRGRTEAIRDVEAIEAQKPAIDKPPSTGDEPVEEETVALGDQVGWVLAALEDADVKTVDVADLARARGIEVLRDAASDPMASLPVVYRYCLTDKNQVGVGVRAFPEGDALDTALASLVRRPSGVTFFVTPAEVADRSADLARAVRAGCTIGLTVPADDCADMDAGAAFDLLYEASQAVGEATGESPVLLWAQSEEGLPALRAASSQLGLRVVMPDESRGLAAGSLVFVDPSNRDALADLDSSAREKGLEVVDMQTAVTQSGTLTSLTAEELAALRQGGDREAVRAATYVRTSDRMLSFAVYGLSNPVAVEDVSARLAALGDHGTFFATLDELMSSPAAIESALAQGHELGICYRELADYPQTFDATATYLDSWRRYAQWRYGADSTIVLSLAPDVTDQALEAMGASGCTLVSPTYYAVRDDERDVALDGVDKALGETDAMRLTRGSFVGFNASFFSVDATAKPGNTVAGAYLQGFVSRHVDTLAFRSATTGKIEDASRFAVVPVSAVLESDGRYEPCEGTQTQVSLDRDVLTDMKDDAARFDYMAARYVGTPTVDDASKLPGFSADEIARMDTSGTLTDKKVIFLTFDDWGTEQSLNEILYVLQKHGVEATFFVKTQYVDYNPNLLRAIAVQGHQVSCHSDAHLPLADARGGDGQIMWVLSDADAQALRQDLVTSYDTLYRYTGDVMVDGRPALVPMFRPPTLAVSKDGLAEVLDVGFTYSVSGEMSTADYDAASYEDMLSRLQSRSIGNGQFVTVHNGTIVVMHMQENARYTAQALDTMIPIWQAQGFAFARIDEYLGR